MTAFLQPGDKIHITFPSDFSSKTRGDKNLRQVVDAYKAMGVEVFLATFVNHNEQLRVVSVFRTPKEASAYLGAHKLPPLEKLPILEEIPPLRARWSAHPDLVWQEDPAEPRPHRPE